MKIILKRVLVIKSVVSTPVVFLCGFGVQSRDDAFFVSLSTQASSGVHLASIPVENGVMSPGVKRPRRGRD